MKNDIIIYIISCDNIYIMDNQQIQQEQVRETQIVTTISNIERQIRTLYSSLEELSVQSAPDLTEQNNILSQIKELQKLKTSLYKTLSSSYASTQASVAEARNSLVDETAVVGVIGNELNIAKKNLNQLQNRRANKVRMAEINDYYSSKYSTQSGIMKTVVYFCVPILILGILMKKSIIPKNIALAIIGILSGLAIVVVGLQVIDVMRRDNMVFDEYNFPFDADAQDLSSDTNEIDQPSLSAPTLNCVGETCCPEGNDFGTVWDDTNKQCVTPSYKSTTSEGFVGEKCLQGAFSKPNVNIDLFPNSSVVTGYNNSDDYAKF